MFLYNVHTPSKTFALAHKEDEGFPKLLDRIAQKAELSRTESQGVRDRKDGAGVVYEYDGGRWSLEDDDDLHILLARLPPSSTSSATLHLTLPHAHAHFAEPPSYSAGKSKNSKKSEAQQVQSAKARTDEKKANGSAERSSSTKSEETQKKVNGGDEQEKRSSGKETQGQEKKKDGIPTEFLQLGDADKVEKTDEQPELAPPLSTNGMKSLGGALPSIGQSGSKSSGGQSGNQSRGGQSGGQSGGPYVHENPYGHIGGVPPTKAFKTFDSKSVRSIMSRKSKYGGDDAEPFFEKHKRQWYEFHNNNGVRTVMGKVGDVDNVRMLLKPGYKGVYVSRTFATKHKLIPQKYAPGVGGYTGLKAIGNISITVGSKTASHPAFMNEENHFDVVLGRQWVERMNVKVDPIDQTILTYMESGESIPCDIVVLKDDQGNKVLIT